MMSSGKPEGTGALDVSGAAPEVVVVTAGVEPEEDVPAEGVSSFDLPHPVSRARDSARVGTTTGWSKRRWIRMTMGFILLLFCPTGFRLSRPFDHYSESGLLTFLVIVCAT
jgi:hypothetical protein